MVHGRQSNHNIASRNRKIFVSNGLFKIKTIYRSEVSKKTFAIIFLFKVIPEESKIFDRTEIFVQCIYWLRSSKTSNFASVECKGQEEAGERLRPVVREDLFSIHEEISSHHRGILSSPNATHTKIKRLLDNDG